MTGDFLITKELLKQYNPCTGGYRWFCERYPDGGKYQKILDALCNDNRFCDASWLLNKIGRTDDVLEVNEIDDTDKSICFAGSVIVKNNLIVKSINAGGSIEAGEYIEAGWSIEAGEYIEAGEFIKAGWSIKAGKFIKAGEFIKAGDDYGLYAGVCVRLSNMQNDGYITAQFKPKNIMCGYWIDGEVSKNEN